MHCRCNLVFCYKCGGVLKSGHGSAKGTSIKECECAGVNQLLAAHEAPGVPNHNLMPQNQVAGAMAAAQAALQAAMQRGPRELAQRALAAAHAGGGKIDVTVATDRASACFASGFGTVCSGR